MLLVIAELRIMLLIETWAWHVLSGLILKVFSIRDFRKEDAALPLSIKVDFLLLVIRIILAWTWLVLGWLAIVNKACGLKDFPLDFA
jgi:hypothetical protein